MGEPRGNPYLRLRVEPEVLELLKVRVGEGRPGRSGGVSAWVRALIYRELGLGEPPVYAGEESPRRTGKRAEEEPEPPVEPSNELAPGASRRRGRRSTWLD